MVGINALGHLFVFWTHKDIEHFFQIICVELIICVTSFVKNLFMYYIHFGIA